MRVSLISALGRLLPAMVVGCLLSTSGLATTVDAPDFPELVNESDYVVRGVVKSVSSEYRPNASGTGRKIITRVEVEVREVLAGTPPAKVVLEFLGGRIGNEEMILEGAPRFSVGSEDILFVSGNGRTICPLYGMMHGRYPVMREPRTGRQFVARCNRVPLRDPAEVALPVADGNAAELQRRMATPEQALTPDQFAQHIKAAVKPGYIRAKKR